MRGESFRALDKIYVGDEVPRVVVQVHATVTAQVCPHRFEVAPPVDDMFQDAEGDDGVRGLDANVVRRRVDDLHVRQHPARLFRGSTQRLDPDVTDIPPPPQELAKV